MQYTIRQQIGTAPHTHQLYIDDNLRVLTEHATKPFLPTPDIVYIDPPYNTQKSFVYDDQQSQDTWSNDMIVRIQHIHAWLPPHGILLIHIDEHEYANLFRIVANIFHPSNDLGTIIWDKIIPKGDSRGISCHHEPIIAFAKHAPTALAHHPFSFPKPIDPILRKAQQLHQRIGKKIVPPELLESIRLYGLDINPKDHAITLTHDTAQRLFRQWLNTQNIKPGLKLYNQLDDQGIPYRPCTMAWPNHQRPPDKYFAPLIHPITQKPCPVPARGWRNPPDTMKRLLDTNNIVFGKDETTQPQRILRITDNTHDPFPSIIPCPNTDATLMRKLGIPFDTPKPVALQQRIIAGILGDSGGTVADIYAGSGTIGHACMRLQQSGIPVQSILMQSPEPFNNTPTGRQAAQYCRTHRITPCISSLTIERLARCIAQESLPSGWSIWEKE